jgi:lysophospholipid acyltransferase (LPLAT)-like uncharacterized protein
MTEGWWNSVLMRVGPAVIAWITRLLLWTCRLRDHDAHRMFPPNDKTQLGIASFWHNSIICVLYRFRKYRVAAMVSASRDGEWVSRVLQRFGLKTIRGSRNQRGSSALKEMLRALKEGYNCGIVADGSQGPPLIAQPGAILLAARMQVPIIPVCWSASRYWIIRSWDRTIIPKPFAVVDFYFGELLHIPREMDQDGIERYRLKLEQRLNELYHQAWAAHGKSEH